MLGIVWSNGYLDGLGSDTTMSIDLCAQPLEWKLAYPITS
jgi:hypothetical protein